MSRIKDFRDLNVWNIGMDITVEIYQFTKDFPEYELYGITSQMRKAAVSIPSNIAEGFARSHNKEYRQFLYISLGSCAELETQVEIAGRLKYLSDNSRKHLIEILQQLGRMLTSLIKCITENISFSPIRKSNRSSLLNQQPATSDPKDQEISTINKQQVPE
ncbi:MAG: four helix bundle protein [Lentisphaerae bacterium]|nr:four helix bundle protein [Lentisphaerota bacterium]